MTRTFDRDVEISTVRYEELPRLLSDVSVNSSGS